MGFGLEILYSQIFTIAKISLLVISNKDGTIDFIKNISMLDTRHEKLIYFYRITVVIY
jgi:hypothetical protein